MKLNITIVVRVLAHPNKSKLPGLADRRGVSPLRWSSVIERGGRQIDNGLPGGPRDGEKLSANRLCGRELIVEGGFITV